MKKEYRTTSFTITLRGNFKLMTFGDDWETRLQHAVSNIRHAKIQLTPFPYFLVEPFSLGIYITK